MSGKYSVIETIAGMKRRPAEWIDIKELGIGISTLRLHGCWCTKRSGHWEACWPTDEMVALAKTKAKNGLYVIEKEVRVYITTTDSVAPHARKRVFKPRGPQKRTQLLIEKVKAAKGEWVMIAEVGEGKPGVGQILWRWGCEVKNEKRVFYARWPQ